jgi:hypothetical protein
MNELDSRTFTSLFNKAYEKCFGYPIKEPLSETESKLFSNRLYDQTGLVVGWKSLKNYSSFIVDGSQTKQENPSTATLDSLARYVVDAPYSSEIERKSKESHFPYWFGFKEKFLQSLKREKVPQKTKATRQILFAVFFILLIIFTIFLLFNNRRAANPFIEEFKDLSMASLNQRGWFIKSPDSVFWRRRAERANRLTLFTLRGDNWPNAHEKIGIQNLLLRKITKDCFETEVHFADFIPLQDWQQAGILLLEDTNFTGKSIRLSVAYNDFFGGYNKPREIIIQAITSLGKSYSEPEEIAHQPIVYMDSIRQNPALLRNLATGALKIEKEGNKFRFLYSGGSVSNPAFKEVVTHEFDMHPKYLGIFAIKGFVDSTASIPVQFTFFRLKENNCQ